MKNILFLASPGAGKGTQSEILAKNFNLIHLSSGHLLRNEVESNTELGQKVKNTIADGLLVADEIIIELIKNQININPNAEGFIFDGFPRTARQAAALDEILIEHNCPLNLVIILEITDEEIMKRLLNRAKIEGRHDDDEEVIKSRITVYKKQTQPLIDYYENQNKTILINGAQEIEAVAHEINKIILNFNKK